jgi:TolB-like protein/Flp pilus assembly protein TadD
MPVRTAASSPTAANATDEKIREQLERILASRTFHAVERLKRFLSFIASETLEGRGDQLKEFVVGIQVFAKEASFDPRNDPIVRVQARRLRARLERYYQEEGQADELVIELPKGGYATVIRTREAPARKRIATPALIGRNTVMMLPLEDLSQKGELGYLCRGISLRIIHTLTNLESIRVVASGNTAGSAGEMGTSAAALVGGNVDQQGSDWRITLQIIDGASGSYVWSESFEDKPGNAFQVQEEAARRVAAKLQIGLTEGRSRMGFGKPPENLAAFNLYQQGRYHLNQRTEEGMRKSVEFFERVIAEDPHYALAYSGLADSYGLLGHYGVLAPADVWTKRASNAAWAVLEDDDSSEAHTSLAHVKATQDWDWTGAEAEFRRAIELDPRNATAHHWYAMACLGPMGRLDEAADQLALAQALDPISSIIARDKAVIQYYRRAYEDALEKCDQTIELNPHFSPAYWTLALIQQQRGDYEEAAAACQRALELSPQSPRLQGALGRTYALWGKREQALEILDELHKLADVRYVSPFEFASLLFAIGDQAAGYDWLKRAFQDRCFELMAINVDPRFDELRKEPAFVTLASQLGL